MRRPRTLRAWASGGAIGVLTMAMLLMLGRPGFSAGNDEPEDPVTFSRDVAPIFQQQCQECHQPNSVAPMSLLTYHDARPWARRIKQQVATRVMPPWHIDKTVGIKEFKNDRSLTDEQIHTIVQWVDDGAPEGDPADLPPPVEWPDPARWQLSEQFGEPDLIVRSKPYSIAAQGMDKWWRPYTPTGLTEKRWVRAIEINPSVPGGHRAVHHVLAYLIQDEEGVTGLPDDFPIDAPGRSGMVGPGLFMEWAIGKVGEIFPPDAGKLMLPGSQIRWEVHYHAYGEELVDDTVELGVYFYPADYVPRNRTILRMIGERSRESRIDIPPGEISVIEHFGTLPAPARIENFQPHMHMRGKAQSMEALYPDGTIELLSMVSNFQWNWHNNYVYAEHVAPLLPAGTILKITSWHDNTADNPNNPDATQWVGYGDRTVDEMAHVWFDVTYLTQDDYKLKVAERQTKGSE